MPARILIVEDNDATRTGLTELLHQAGYAPVACSTFKDAKRALEEQPPDLLIADLRLDGFNGLQLVAVNPRPVPAIIITGHPDHVLAQDARQLGAEFLLKPFAPATLLDLVARQLAEVDGVEVGVDGAEVYERTRRWARKPLTTALAAQILDRPARVLEISYGGIRFETEGEPEGAMRGSVRLVLPDPALSIDVDVVWANRCDEHRWLCGAEVSDDSNPDWRNLVDATA